MSGKAPTFDKEGYRRLVRQQATQTRTRTSAPGGFVEGSRQPRPAGETTSGSGLCQGCLRVDLVHSSHRRAVIQPFVEV